MTDLGGEGIRPWLEEGLCLTLFNCHISPSGPLCKKGNVLASCLQSKVSYGPTGPQSIGAFWDWVWFFSPKDFIQEASTVPPNIEQSPLCYIVSPCWLSILNIPVYTCWSQTKQTHFLSITLSLSEFFLWWDVKNPSFIKSWNQVHELRRPWVLTRVKSQPHAFRSQSTLHSFSSTGRSSAHKTSLPSMRNRQTLS